MPLSPNEIKDRALKFALEWQEAVGERAEAQTFWNELFHVFGIERRRVGTFEKRVSRLNDALNQASVEARGGYIDLFWPGVLIAEHKSRGKDLDSAFQQALDYTDYLKKRELPRYLIVSDFARIRLYDLEQGEEHEVKLNDLHRHIHLFGFMAGYSPLSIREQDPVNVRAAERMGRLYDKLADSGYPQHDLKVLLVRLLFCLFAEDTTLFEPQGAFQEYLENNTREDGSNLGATLNWLFEILNVPYQKRQANLDERIAALPYVNGKLFDEHLRTPAFDAAGRETLLECCALDWGRISPAVFGSLFQSVMDKDARRQLGAHYTTEKNILKVIKPLFLDELRSDFEKARYSPKKLFELHKRIGTLLFLDPACGCGNFLVIAYRELRLLELEVLRTILTFERESGQRHIDVFELIHVNVDQFYGIEIEEFPAQIAQVALWLTDHQMNLMISEEFGHYFRRLPLEVSPTIKCANALERDWDDVLSGNRVNYILGNPPFGGKQFQNTQQKQDMRRIFNGVKGAGNLDYVSAWYLQAGRYLLGRGKFQRNLGESSPISSRAQRVKVAFVSTNSITQGEQVSVLWNELLRIGMKIHFAHRTFQWQSEARGKAAVHCVIIGFAFFDSNDKRIYDYMDLKSDPVEVKAENINPYLVDAPDVLVTSRSTPISNSPRISYGSFALDDGNFTLDEQDVNFILSENPEAKKFIRKFIGGAELLNNKQRWCLWLIDAEPKDIRELSAVNRRVRAVQKWRASRNRTTTKELAKTPTRFAEIRQPDADYIAIPTASSENRDFIPIAFLGPDVIASNQIYVVAHATNFHFGVLSSTMHMSWLRHVGGRLKSDYRYSGAIVYNNFPWPQSPSQNQMERVERAAQGVLDVRNHFHEASLAELYDTLAMPPALRKAHADLDRAVDSAYGRKKFKKEADRVGFLFDLYSRYLDVF